MRVGFDIDGVGYNFGDSVNRTLQYIEQGHLWKSGPTPNPFWDFYKDWGWTTEQFIELCNLGVDAGIIFQGPARPNFFEAMHKVREMGHEVIVVTDRSFGSTPERSHKATYNWFDWHGFMPDEIHFSRDKCCVPTDMFVEDKLENYDALDAAGVRVFLINRPWNQVTPADTRRRIEDVADYARAVQFYGMLHKDMV